MGSLCTHTSLNSAGSLLDEIVSQSDCGLDNRLYKLVNYQKGGKLIEAYDRGGSKEVESVAKKELKDFMYNDGDGMILTQDYYFKWRNHNNNEIVVQMDPPNHYKLDVPKFVERKICWRLESRGLLGESILHVLILCNSKIHTRIAKVLLRLYSYLSWDIIEGEEYFGASALHLAIAYHNSELVKQLVECGSNVNQRATGRFFLPHDQQQIPPKKKTDFDGLCYLGEYPLAWAASCDDEPAYNLLLARGADPNMRDTFGNMILHMVVIRDKFKMYGYALRHPQKPAKDNILNNYGLTPLTLACKLGRNKVFREMLELSSFAKFKGYNSYFGISTQEFWRYSNITCSGYPLNALDTILPNGKTNWNSALMLILEGQTNEHLDMLDGGVLQRLLEEKWKTFARQYFLKKLALVFLHLITLCIAVYLRPPVWEPLLGRVDVKTICRYCVEIVACLGCVSFVIFQQGEEILAQGLVGFLFNLTNPSKVIFLMSNIFILVCIPCRIFGERDLEDFFLSFALPGMWFFLIFFAGAVRLTGPFITMIYSMIVGDMFRFSIIYVIFLLGFTQAFFFLFKSNENERFESFPRTWMTLFHMTLGYYEYSDFGRTYYQMVTRLVFVAFMVIMPILMLNMLIAMMGNTYCKVIIQSEREWMRQWAKIVVALERAIDQKQAKDFLQSYSISTGSGDNDENETRAVMVIKTKLKSKARQRKGALLNWKRICKKIVQELRQNGGTAEGVHVKFHNQANLSATKLHYTIKSDESENEGAAGVPPKKDGLEDALNQLVFAHDLDIKLKANSPSSSPTKQKTQQSEAAKTAEDVLLIREERVEPIMVDEFQSGANEAIENTDLQVSEGINNMTFIHESGTTEEEHSLTTENGMRSVKVLDIPTIVITEDHDLHVNRTVDGQIPKVKLKKRHKRRHLFHRTKIGVIEEELEQSLNYEDFHVLPQIVRPRTCKKSSLRKHTKGSKPVEECSSDGGSAQKDAILHFRRRRHKKKKPKTVSNLEMDARENIPENHSQLKNELEPWSTENVVAMTSLLHWEDELEMF